MNTQEPAVSPTGRYNTKQASALLGISEKTLKRYTERGVIRCGIHKTNGRRFYTGLEILKVWKASY